MERLQVRDEMNNPHARYATLPPGGAPASLGAARQEA